MLRYDIAKALFGVLGAGHGNDFWNFIFCTWNSVLHFYVSLFWFVDNQAASDCNLEPAAYEFFTQAFVLYEEEVAVIVSELSLQIRFIQ